MKALRYILKNINLLNLLLLFICFLFVEYAVYPLFQIEGSYKIPAPKKSEVEEEKIPAQSTPSAEDYSMIVQRNLFHPERHLPAEKKEEDMPITKPEFVLYGTLVTRDISLAYISDRNSPLPAGRRHLTLKKGDMLSGYTLTEIEEDRVVMTKDEEKMVVNLYDAKKTKESPIPQQPHPTPARRPLPRPAAPQQNAKPLPPN